RVCDLALTRANEEGIKQTEVQSLVTRKQKARDAYLKTESKVLSRMNLSTNVIELQDAWVAIRYVNGSGDLSLEIESINYGDRYLLKRDGRVEKEVTIPVLEYLMPACIDSDEKTQMDYQVLQRATKLLEALTSYEAPQDDIDPGAVLDSEVGTGTTSVSKHSATRYVQRVLKIGANNEAVAEEHRRDN